MSALKYGLNIQKKPGAVPSRPAPPKKSLFGDDESDEDVAPSTSAAPAAKKPVPRTDIAALQTQRKVTTAAADVDPSIYDYDAAYDALHAKSAEREAREKADARERKPKYINGLLASAEVRKRDQLRARDKQLQREREAEGDEFADKDKFVTEAYKAQQEEVKRLEEEEKLREVEEQRKRKEMGMQGFYRGVMDREEQAHQEAVQAAAGADKPGERKEGEEGGESKEKTDVEIAKEMNEKGANIIINEEGQVADKRQLLSAGLNVSARPKPSAASSHSATGPRPSGLQQGVYQGGRAGVQRAVRERQSRMIEEQLEQAAKRAADDEAEEQRRVEHAAKSRKTEVEKMSARERYLQRKKEAATATAGASKNGR